MASDSSLTVLAPPSPRLSFLAVGDWGRRGTEAQRAVAQGMARAARRLGSAFVLTTGDNFYENGVESTDDAHWQESFEAVYGDALPQDTPWYAALGNHDYRGSVAAQIAYARQSDRWHLPARFYTFPLLVGAEMRAQFFVLDTTPFLSCYRPGGSEPTAGVSGQDPDRQLVWLRRALAASTAPWKIVVGHHPVLNGSPFHGPSDELRSMLQPLLEEHGVQLYLCGHEHDLQHLQHRGVHYVVSGAGAECRATGASAETCFSQAALGFAALTLTPRALHVRLCDETARVLHHTQIERQRQALVVG